MNYRQWKLMNVYWKSLNYLMDIYYLADVL